MIDQDEGALRALHASRPEDISDAELSNFVAGLPRRYLSMFDREEIYRHVRLWRNIAPDDVHFSLKKTADVWELTVVTLDKPHLFSNICGVLSYFDMNILRGHALTSQGLLALDVFQFADPDRVFEKEPRARAEFESLLSDVVARRTEIASLLDRKEWKIERPHAPPVIYFDNDYSKRYTVLELIADAAPGLLYRISRAVARHGFDVALVLISTEGQRAIDVFHLRKGSVKLTDSDQLVLTEDLERALEGGEGPRQVQ